VVETQAFAAGSNLGEELRESLIGAVPTDPIAVFNGRFDFGGVSKPAHIGTGHLPAVDADIGEQTSSVKAKPPVLELPSFGAGVCGSVAYPAIMS
jgi:hypothetical protein